MMGKSFGEFVALQALQSCAWGIQKKYFYEELGDFLLRPIIHVELEKGIRRVESEKKNSINEN
jgi:hypothetical protein